MIIIKEEAGLPVGFRGSSDDDLMEDNLKSTGVLSINVIKYLLDMFLQCSPF